MREKTRLFRSLLLESLETRTVFAVDGFDGGSHLVTPNARIDITRYHNDGMQVSTIVITVAFLSRGDDFGGPWGGEVPPRFADFEDDHELIPEGEGPGPDLAPRPDRPSRPPNTTDLNPPALSFTPVAPSTNFPTILLSSKPTTVPRIDSTPPVASDAAPSTITPSHNLPGGSLASGSLANTALANPSLTNRAAPTLVAQPANSQSSLLAASTLSALGSEGFAKADVSFDLSTSIGNDLTRRLTPSHLRANDFRFTRNSQSIGDSILEPALVDRAIGAASLDKLLSDLANKHRQHKSGNDSEREHSNRNEFAHRQHHQDSQSAEIDAAYAEGGLIAMTLNRDIAPTDLDALATNLHQENKAWVASVGVFRAFESSAMAVTEGARRNNGSSQTTQGANSLADRTEFNVADMNAADLEASETRFNPFLASSTVALGAVLFSLRRIRHSARLMYTTRQGLGG